MPGPTINISRRKLLAEAGAGAAARARTGLRCVFAESVRDSENVAGPMSPDGLANSETPKFSPKLRDDRSRRDVDPRLAETIGHVRVAGDDNLRARHRASSRG